MKKSFLFILLFVSFSSVIFAKTTVNIDFLEQVKKNKVIIQLEEKNFEKSQTLLVESNKDYVVVENKTSLVYIPLISAATFEPYNKVNDKYIEVADKECKKNKARFNLGKEVSDFYSHVVLINKNKAKFICVSMEENYKFLLYKLEDFKIQFCPPINPTFEIICNETDIKIKRHKLEFLNLTRKDSAELAEEQKKIKLDFLSNRYNSQKSHIKACKMYGFKQGTEDFGKCILKLLDIDIEFVKLRLTVF